MHKNKVFFNLNFMEYFLSNSPIYLPINNIMHKKLVYNSSKINKVTNFIIPQYIDEMFRQSSKYCFMLHFIIASEYDKSG